MKHKRWRTALVASLAVLALAGCGKKEEVKDGPSSLPPAEVEKVAQAVEQPFSALAKIHMGGIEAEADLNKTEEGAYSFRFTEPKSLSGMVISMKGDTMSLSFMGLSIDADSETVLNSAVTKAIITAINKAAESKGVAISAEGTAIIINGETDSGEFTLTLDAKNQSLLTLSIPSLDLECSFGGQA